MTTMLRRVVGAVLAAGLTAAGALVAAAPAQGVEGLEVTAVSRYEYDAPARAVHATMTLDLRNVSPTTERDGGVLQYYYDAYAVPVPRSSTEVRARSGDQDLSVSTSGTDDPSIALARISFPDLTYAQTRRIVLTFDITGESPRSADQTRMGPGYATFVVYGPGDPGRNRVEVVAPTDLTFTSTTDGFDGGTGGPTSTYTATANTFEGGLWAVVSLRDPEQSRERLVDVEDLSLILESFPDDRQWSSFVADRVTTGLPVLERLVDSPWPGELQRIREDAAPSLRGYDGWYDPTGEEIVVGEQLDADLIYHELSHAWLSGDRFDERWLYEGLAQVVADRTVAATGGTPDEQRPVSPTDEGAVPLNAWDGGAGTRAAEVDAYAYPASHRVMTELLAGLDDDELGAVVGAGVRGERAYDPPGTVTPSAGRTSWTDWLDLVQTRGGQEEAPEVFATWVLTDEQRGSLEARARERTGYAAVDRGDGPWLPPEGLRDALTSWDFDRARAVRREVSGLADDVRALQRAAEATGLRVPPSVRRSYERASLEDDYTALASTLPAAAGALQSVAAARDLAAADPDPFTALGAHLLDVDARAAEAVSLLDDGQVAQAQAAADEVAGRSGWMLPLGLGLPLGAVLVLLGVVWLVVVLVRRRVRGGRAGRPGAPTPAGRTGPDEPDPTGAPGLPVSGHGGP
ncbi:hypothetical protein [Phycicoccus flavus]|uniref:hypothetical protein n=1 Tax=Phycicoccus flavus TaxID=2502783 RepID=UPI000FEB6D45|nr:hypothetical protein [Phycicoccus flavus]NHA67151.1 hypothetical protein [Phycicoccus flavus]